MSEPVIKGVFQHEIALVHRESRRLQEVYRLRQHAGSATRAVDAAKTQLADAVIAADELYTRDDLVRVAEATAAAAGYHGARAKAHAARVVDRLTKGET